jgi:xylan 1,4-beta-xylosidase
MSLYVFSHRKYYLMRTITLYILPFALFLILNNIGCSASDGDIPANNANPRFSWFAYEGNDPVFEEFSPADDEYQNPIIAGFYPDPSIVRSGEDYFMVHSSFSFYPGIPLFHSKDLVSWTQVGHVLDRPSQFNLDGLGISHGIFAPTINYNDGVYYVLSTVVYGGGNFIVTSTDPLIPGSWSEPIWLPEADGIDPSIFFDEDGKVYVLHNGPPHGEPLYDGHRAIWMWEYDPEWQKLLGTETIIVDGGVDITQEPVWIEAPHLMKIDGKYVLIAAEGGTGPNHSQVVFRGDAPFGPYIPYENNPILTQRHLDPDRPYPVGYTGHADFVETQNGEWWAVFLGVRPYEGNYFNTGRETFLLPVRWADGWPIILEGDTAVPYVHRRPNLPFQPAPEVPTTGNFTYVDKFEVEELLPYWTFIRTPREKWYDLKSIPGTLILYSRPHEISDRQQPSFIGRRQQHSVAAASVKMNYKPEKQGDIAGLIAFQNDDFYYFLGVTYETDTTQTIQLEMRNNGESTILASETIVLGDYSPIYLTIAAKAKQYDFAYATNHDEWIKLKENADGTILSTHVAGGFVGTMFGMYAYTE